jgi:hypothetical protein
MRFVLPLFLSFAACKGGLAECNYESNLSGAWTINATVPNATPSAFTIAADLMQQMNGSDFLGLSHWVYGTLTASDPSVFGMLTIAQLMHDDDGGKTGVILGCHVQIHVPIAQPVTDDSNSQGPLRILLDGNITQLGAMESRTDTPSTIIYASDATNTSVDFTWTATQTTSVGLDQ